MRLSWLSVKVYAFIEKVKYLNYNALNINFSKLRKGNMSNFRFVKKKKKNYLISLAISQYCNIALTNTHIHTYIYIHTRNRNMHEVCVMCDI